MTEAREAIVSDDELSEASGGWEVPFIVGRKLRAAGIAHHIESALSLTPELVMDEECVISHDMANRRYTIRSLSPQQGLGR